MEKSSYMRYRSYYRSVLFNVLLLVVSVALCSPISAADGTCKVAIVKSWDLPEYNAALEGFHEVMGKRQSKCDTITYNLKGQPAGADAIISEIRKFQPNIILTVGSRATGVISENFEDTPIVFAMVLYPVASAFVSGMDKPGRNLTGAAMDVPIDLQLRMLAILNPLESRILYWLGVLG